MWLIVCVRDGEAGELPFRGAPLHTVRCENDLNKRALRREPLSALSIADGSPRACSGWRGVFVAAVCGI